MKTVRRPRVLAVLVGCAAAVLSISVPLAISAAHADGIGISPVSIDLTDTLRGGTYDGTLTLSNGNGTVDTNFTLHPTGDLAAWVEVVRLDDGTSATTLPVAHSTSVQVAVRVHVPPTAANGTYTGGIEVLSSEVSAVAKQGSGSAVQLGGLVTMSVAVNGTEHRDARVNDVSADKAEVGMAQRISAVVQNLGNVAVQPLVEVSIERNGQSVATLTSKGKADPVAPAATGTEFVDWNTAEAPVGDYTAQVTVTDTAGSNPVVLGHSSVAFRLEQRGTYTRSAELGGLRLLAAPALDQLTQVQATLSNTGKIATSGVVSIEVYRDGKLIDTARSLERAVRPGEAAAIVVPVATQKTGTYRLVATADYEGSITAPQEITFQLGNSSNGRVMLMWAIGGVAAIALASMVVLKVRRQRRLG